MSTFFQGWIASESADGDAIKVKKLYIDLCSGNLYAGTLLSQIMYWHGTSHATGKPRMTIERDGYLWLAKGYDDWYEECRIKEDVARKIVGQLVKSGLLVKEVWKFDGVPTVHLRVNPDVFERMVREFQPNAIRYVVADGNATLYQKKTPQRSKSLTETTTETTASRDDEERPNVYAMYERTFNTTISATMADMLRDAVETYGEARVEDALKKAAAANATSWMYAEKVLRDQRRQSNNSGGKTPSPLDGMTFIEV